MSKVKPYQRSGSSKKGEVTEMFDNIAPSYDRLNHVLSFGIDYTWRNRAIRHLRPYKPEVVVDIATGTADFAIAARKLNPQKIIGIDISPKMLEVGQDKIQHKGLNELIELREGDSEALDLLDDSVDAITVGFGVRNFENLELGLAEMMRVLKPGKAAVILEPAFPTTFPMKQLFYFHFKVLTPVIGKLLSGDKAAYDYLPNSVRAFPHGEEFLTICKQVGYRKTSFFSLTGGICAMYLIEK